MQRAVTIAPRRAVHWPSAIACIVMGWWTLRSGSGGRWIFLDYVNLAFHEAGHVFLSFAGSTVHYLGGTIGQLLVPALLMVRFLRREERPFGAAGCLWWIGQSLVNIATYMADARDLELPLVGGGDHDWNELFYRFGVLDAVSVSRISGITRGAGVLVMLAGMAWMGRLALSTMSPPSRSVSEYSLGLRWWRRR